MPWSGRSPNCWLSECRAKVYMSCTASRRKPPRSPASHNLLKPRPSLARWSGSRRRRTRAEPSGGIVYEPANTPQCPECSGNPRLLCRGTRSSNPSPSSGESANFRFLASVIRQRRRPSWRRPLPSDCGAGGNPARQILSDHNLGAGEQRGEPLQIAFILEDLVSRGVSTSERASSDRAHPSVCSCIEDRLAFHLQEAAQREPSGGPCSPVPASLTTPR